MKLQMITKEYHLFIWISIFLYCDLMSCVWVYKSTGDEATLVTPSCVESAERVDGNSNIECKLKCDRKKMFAMFTAKKQCYCSSNRCSLEGRLQVTTYKDVCSFGFTGDDCNVYTGLGSHKNLPAKSCKTIKETNPTITDSGFYWIQLKKSTRVYCEMTTDGGGWLMIGNINASPPADPSLFVYPKTISNNLEELQTVLQGRFVLDGSQFPLLNTLIGISQFRIFCTKNYHNRTVHVINKRNIDGERFRDYMLGTVSYWMNKNLCPDTFNLLPDDNSKLSRVCTVGESYSRGSQPQHVRLYDHAIYFTGQYHVQINTNRMECDDIYNSNGFKKYGRWEYFVR